MYIPRKCKINKIMSKQIFNGYKELSLIDVKRIKWEICINESTMQIKVNAPIEEIQVFSIELKKDYLPDSLIKAICKEVKYYNIFKIVYNNNIKYAFLDEKVYYSENMTLDDFELSAINTSVLYDNMRLKVLDKNISSNYSLEIVEVREREKKVKEIEKLKKLYEKEKQPSKQAEYRRNFKKLESELN